MSAIFAGALNNQAGGQRIIMTTGNLGTTNGFTLGSFGSMNPGTLRGFALQRCFTNTQPWFEFGVSDPGAILPSTWIQRVIWNRVNLPNPQVYLTSAASFVQAAGFTYWRWTVVPLQISGGAEQYTVDVS